MQPNPHIKYFKRAVDGDDIVSRPTHWGRSAIYFETSEEGFVIRQIQMFESGVVLVYDDDHYHDEYGWRWMNEVYSEPPVTVAITSKDFHRAWMRHREAKNRSYPPVKSSATQDQMTVEYVIAIVLIAVVFVVRVFLPPRKR